MSNPNERLAAAHNDGPRDVSEFHALAPARRVGNQLWLSGQVASKNGALVASGRVGADVDLDAARLAARQCALNLLEVAKSQLGDLSKVESILRLVVYVASDEKFIDQHLVAHAATDVFFEVLGDTPHVRTAIGVANLPTGSAVEADAVLLLND